MGRNERGNNSRAKRKLDMEDASQDLSKKQRNTSVKVTEYTSCRCDGNAGKQTDKLNNSLSKRTRKQKLADDKLLEKNNKETVAHGSKQKLIDHNQTSRKSTEVIIHDKGEKQVTSPIEGEIQLLPNQVPIENEMFDGDGVQVNVNTSDDEFLDEGVVAGPSKDSGKKSDQEDIPPEVIEQLKNHPGMQKFVMDMVEVKLNERIDENRRSPTSQGKVKQWTQQLSRIGNRKDSEKIKSPSDTTIYRPALYQDSTRANDMINKISNFVEDMLINASKQVTPVHRHEHS